MTSDFKKLAIALVVTLLAYIGLSLPYPVLTPLFIDATPTPLNSWAGFSSEVLFTAIIAIYPLGIFIGSSFIGALSDRFGRRKVLAQTLGVCLLGYLVSAYALYNNDFLLLIISRFLTGITEGNVAIARAIALDIGGEQSSGKTMSKTRAVSLVNSAIFVGWLLGPLIGGALADIEPYWAMIAAAVGAFICLLLVQFWLAETAQIKATETKNVSVWHSVLKENSLHLIRDPWGAKFFVMYLFFCLGISMYYEFYPVWLVDYQGFNSLQIGLATVCMTVFMTLTSVFLVTRIQEMLGFIKPLVHLIWLLALSVALVPFTFSWSTFLMFAVSGVFIASFNGLLPVYLSDSKKDKGNGAVMGLITTTFCIANFFAALIGGALLMFDAAIPLFGSAALFLLSGYLFYKHFYKVERQQAEKSPSQINQQTTTNTDSLEV